MPELPEVETVRAGLERWVSGRVVAAVEVRHPRAIRRHVAGAADFEARLLGRRLGVARRRGKYLWLPLDDADGPDGALLGHLGMSGQLLVQPASAPDEAHLHVRIAFTDGGPELRFVDQRTFGGLLVDELAPAPGRPGDTVPELIAHIARDPLDPAFDEAAFVARLRRRRSGIKRALLDQSLISGVGNIYADEALWRAKLHGERLAAALSRPAVHALLTEVRAVLGAAIIAGGTSFDSLYVNVNGESGYFDRTLNVYGREGEPCNRCGAPIRRVAFMNRSSYFCPHCQRRPRAIRA
ncbi:MAG TPA: bifunctional DNA-formamidopyrimidine glycosylase/DNA-(apurinic or apyrimidinic site) lyase [Jatrophihabitantaceae bacterium]|nr:bifunctional DNA-formamidopyrimidine glycosylase/DNA-(apurinic or apyrimidinic site) lyase [Jatrophihabitantaceae bacterium]